MYTELMKTKPSEVLNRNPESLFFVWSWFVFIADHGYT